MYNKNICAALLALAFASSAAVAQSNWLIRFDQSRYDVSPGDGLSIQVLIDPVPPSGIFSFGVEVTLEGTTQTAFTSVMVPADLDFNGPQGPDAVIKLLGSQAAAKGTVNLFASPFQTHRTMLLATFVLSNLNAGTYALRVRPYVTLGSTEQVFVDGQGAVLDQTLSFGSAIIAVGGGGAYAIFAGNPDDLPKDKVIEFKGKNNIVTGKIHSNRDIRVSGKGHVFRDGTVKYVTEVKPKQDFGGKVTLQGATLEKSEVTPFPVDFRLADFALGGSAALAAQAEGKYFQIGKKSKMEDYIANGVLREGLYYVEGDLKVPDKAVRGRVTLVATGHIEVKSKNGIFESYTRCLLAFADSLPGKKSDTKIKISGKNSRWQGVIFSPHGRVEIGGDSTPEDVKDSAVDQIEFDTSEVTILGSLIGQSVKIDSKNFRITGLDPSLCPPLASPLRPVLAGGQLQIAFPSVNGLNYVIEYTDSLSAPLWRQVTAVTGDGSVKTVRPPATVTQRFYRLRLE